MKLLLTTAQAILALELTRSFELAKITTIDDGSGLYFGITRGPDRFYVVSRNLEAGLQVRTDPTLPTNAISEWSVDRLTPIARWTHPRFVDLHQIRYRAGKLFVLTAEHPHLLTVDPQARAIVCEHDLARLVPPDLQRSGVVNPDNPTDLYHFNSLSFLERKLFILAHNWSNQPSFALSVSLEKRLRRLNVYRDLGVASHDILARDNTLYVLDSNGARVIVRGSRTADVAVPGSARFPRGLAVSSRFLFIASGLQSAEHACRRNSATFLTIVSRDTFQVVRDLFIGDYGNTFDITTVDERDWTDNPVLSPWLGWIVAGLHRIRR